MNKKATRSSEWYLLPKQAVKDKNLTTSDKNVLSVLIYLSKAFGDSFFRGRDKLVEDLRDSNVELSSKQVSRCICKLKELGYIDYVAGFHNNKEGFGKVSEFTLSYKTDNQDKYQNNVHPNTNTKPNTNTNTKSNTKCTYNKTSNKEIAYTSNISTLEVEKFELSRLMNTYWIDGDCLPLFEYYREHQTNDTFQTIKKALNDEDKQGFENFSKNL
ncbi:MAG: hypothetical protein II453_14350 [Alphaproteobacteria bacterium]|nr:hypothetical protein [Alphaproteobacteria bacterium]